MSESQEEITPKKSIGWKLAIGLSLIFIILVASVAYLAVTLVAAQNSYENILKALQTENGQLQTSNTDLQNQVDNLTHYLGDIADMQWQTRWLDTYLNVSDSWSTSVCVNYAGYVDLRCSSASPFNVSVTVGYAMSIGPSYDSTVYDDQADPWLTWFPVLPSNVSMSVTVLSTSAPVRVFITYVH